MPQEVEDLDNENYEESNSKNNKLILHFKKLLIEKLKLIKNKITKWIDE